MPIRAVIFDFGGVLVRTRDSSGRRKWEDRLGLREGQLSDVVFDSQVSQRATLGHVPESAVWANVGTALGLSGAEVEELGRDFWAGDALDIKLVAFLRGLRSQYRTAILSNAWSSARDAFVDRFGLADAVDLMVISAEEGVAKPDPAIYRTAVERLGVLPEEAVFVDDMPANVDAARAVGLKAVRFVSREQAMEEVLTHLSGS